ncbi:hypothetical protein M413DRAFT_30817 [Hebeloma cylindrosporum]|uniref:Protein kinase domain-containing protein n=1 Tax=Hebeloma cylindrosporum TaxID=76867 RepID=A0A0C3BLR9_HEBCY|nr:hypothetical protein M413DRAFT_30817 [Hebeloma cylindrosporum h7]
MLMQPSQFRPRETSDFHYPSYLGYQITSLQLVVFILSLLATFSVHLPKMSPDNIAKIRLWRTLSGVAVDGLVNLLKKILVLDPALLPTTVQVLQDPWFLQAMLVNAAHP